MRTKKKYIHVNQHVIRANKKHGKNDPVITIKQGSTNTYCHAVDIKGPSHIPAPGTNPRPNDASFPISARNTDAS